jgi:threonine synthase
MTGLVGIGEARSGPTAIGLPIRYHCAGCGFHPAAGEPVPPRCPESRPDDDIDHVMTRLVDVAALTFPTNSELNPFIRYRTLFHAYHFALAHGWTDADYVALVERLDAAVAAIGGVGFRVTPFQRQIELSERLGFVHDGGVLVKDETRNVSGSHKARHLMGAMIELQVAEAIAGSSSDSPRLAIASCGNAALAAAVVAAAAGRDLDVFIPPDAHPAVIARLEILGAQVTVCERQPGIPGDPTVGRLHAAVEAGSVPFTCQGDLNGFAIEGGLTLGYELAEALDWEDVDLGRLFVQVGGGALASSVIGGIAEARALGLTVPDPIVHPVEAAAVAPLARAHERLADRLDTDEPSDEDFAWAARHRSAFMWPWESEPHSVAGGIVDDETYDWLAVVRGTIASGGSPVLVDEGTLVEANELARATTGIDVDPTGSAGLAGLVHLRRQGLVAPDETVAVLFTGIRRDDTPDPATPPETNGGAR